LVEKLYLIFLVEKLVHLNDYWQNNQTTIFTQMPQNSIHIYSLLPIFWLPKQLQQAACLNGSDA